MKRYPSAPLAPSSARARTASVAGLAVAIGFFLVSLGSPVLAQESKPAATGTSITGAVSNAVTKALLTGATIEIADTHQTVMSDELGHFEFYNVPPGPHTVTVTYTGMELQQQAVESGGEPKTTLTFRLQPETAYKLATFQVTTEAAGNSESVTTQRNSINLITVAATDSFGNLASQNPGQVLMRLPGVAPTITQDGEVNQVSIRGMAGAQNTVTSDGAILAPVASNATRLVRFTTNTTEQFDQLEVVKGLTPDMDASGVGGAIIMKTKSPLSLADTDYQIDYRMGARWAPPFAPHNATRRTRSTQPDLAFGYIGVFSVLGGHRNLGVSVNGTYYESVGDYAETTRSYQNTVDPNAYIYDYRADDYYFNRRLYTLGGRVDYKVSDETKVSFRTANNFYDVFGGEIFNQVRAFTAQTVATLDANGNPTGTGAILPNYSATRTEARPLAASGVQLLPNQAGQLQFQRSVQLVAEHNTEHWEVKADANYALGRLDQMSGQNHNDYGTKDHLGGSFSATDTGVGYVIDSSQSQANPAFIQTAGPSVFDINNYHAGLLTLNGSRRDAHVYSAKLDVKYNLPDTLLKSSYLKAGIGTRRQDSLNTDKGQDRYTYVGPAGGTDSLAAFVDSNNDNHLDRAFGALSNVPRLSIGSLTQNLIDHPSYWTEDAYYREMQKYALESGITEHVGAGYLLGNAQFGQLTILGGARWEGTTVNAYGWALPKTHAEITDPVLRTAAEYVKIVNVGSYNNVLPSAHATYKITPRLIAQASFSTGLGRPEYTNLVPTEAVNDTLQTVTLSNPSLKPETATNYDLGLSYYTRSSGFFSAAIFEKDLKEFIFSSASGTIGSGNSNGFNGQYSGYSIISQQNGGNANVKGIELSMQQQINFGPDWLREFGGFANYTHLTSEGNYGGTTSQSISPLAEFVPEAWNVGVHFSSGRFRANAVLSYVGNYLFTYSTTPALDLYKTSFTTTILSASWAQRRGVEYYCDVYNAFNESQSYYFAIPQHIQGNSVKGMIISLGVRGRF